MPFEVNAEQQQLASTVRAIMEARGRPRESFDGGPSVDSSIWDEMVQLGATSLLLPEKFGGQGASLMDQTIVAEQAGWACAAMPIVGPAVAGYLLGQLGTDAAAATARALVQGSEIVMAAVSASEGIVLPIEARQIEGGWCLTGVVNDLLEAACAHRLVLRASSPSGAGWFDVATGGLGVEAWEQPSLDPTQRLTGLGLDSAPAIPLGTAPSGVLETMGDLLALVLLAAQAVGAADHALQMTVEYAKTRRAFGQPIGRFQAIKHRLSDMLVLTENARSATYNAAWAIDESREDMALAAHMAKAVATENAVEVVHGAIQSHGGIGFTWEYDLHLYLRRAKSCELVLGSPDDHFESIAALILDQSVDQMAAT